MIVLNQKERISDFLVEQGVSDVGYTQYEAIGLEKDGKIVAGVIYDWYEENARCSTHIAAVGKHWMTKKFLWMIFDYPFNQLNVNVIVNTVSSANTKSIKFTEHLGFTEVARIPNGFKDGDLIIYTLHKENCKWIRNNYAR